MSTMYDAVWEVGDSSELLRKALKSYIDYWRAQTEYKSLLPRQHIRVVMEGEKQHAGITILLKTEKSPTQAWPFDIPVGDNSGKGALEEYHTIGIVVKSDKKSGGAEAASKTHNVLQSLFMARPDSTAKGDLISRGIYNVTEAQESLNIDPGSEDDEGASYSKQITLNCSTVILID